MRNELHWDQVLRSLNAKKAEFYPVTQIDEQRNAKKFLRIELDGSVTARVFLDIFDMDTRERVICLHYLRHRVRHFHDEDVGIKFVSRDDPWDFGIELSNAQQFNVEITSIADSEDHFKIAKREERLTHYCRFERLPLHEVRNLAKFFGDEKVDEFVREANKSTTTKSDEVPNPFFSKSGRLVISSLLQPDITLSDQIRRAVDSKIGKRHADKEKTILIVDNRSSAYDAPDYRTAVAELSDYWSDCPFPEVWFYTGYCSDTDGTNAEFSFAPLKITDLQASALKKIYNARLRSNDGRVVW